MSPAESLPRIRQLPDTLPEDGAIDIALVEGVPVFRASRQVQEHVESLLTRHASGEITPTETDELDRYKDIDDYLSHLNRVVRNMAQAAAA